MTDSSDEIIITQKFVLFFDLCSSTSIIEDLARSESQKLWRDVLIELKIFLTKERDNYKYDIYKFLGDGWILLFDNDDLSRNIIQFLKCLCEQYDLLFKKHVKGVLSTPIYNVGITFGLDKGTLIKIVMNSKVEYIGRPLNVASRLQGAIKDKDKNPQGKLLMSNKAYEEIKKEINGKYRIYPVERRLRNISGGENYLAKILYLFDIHNHFYTTSAVERDRALNELGYTYKKISCYVHQTQYPDTIPLYRLWNSMYDDHFYTTSSKERDNAVTEFGYTFEGVSCYIYQTHISGTIPLYRLWNYKNNDHFYTTSIEERDNFVVNLGYIEEVSYYVMGVNNPGTIPLFCLIKTA